MASQQFPSRSVGEYPTLGVTIIKIQDGEDVYRRRRSM